MIRKNPDLQKIIRESLKLENQPIKNVIDESYVAIPKQYDLPSEMLTRKNKQHHKELYEKYIDALNRTSVKLEAANRAGANPNHCDYRRLKTEEIYNLNAVYLHELFFANISDIQSEITTSDLSHMRLSRDFGTFDDWQRDFMACALSARSGWAITAYSTFLRRFINFFVDSHDCHVPVGCYPVIVLDVWEHAYYRDYLSDRKTFIIAMMKELQWEVIENRFKRADRIAEGLQ